MISDEIVNHLSNVMLHTGKAGEFIDRGDNTYGGKYVINPSGGLISKGHPLGATGIVSVSLCYVAVRTIVLSRHMCYRTTL